MLAFKRLFFISALAIFCAKAEQGPGNNSMPDNPYDLDTVVCQGDAAYNCMYLVHDGIHEPTFDNPENLVKKATKNNGERIYVTRPGTKGTIEGKCLKNSNSGKTSKITFSFSAADNADLTGRAWYQNGVISAQFRSNWDNVLNAKNRYIESKVQGDDLRVYCSRQD
ncbi:unnamed protein product [Sympodiomycopsis kandeliae]